ncbi:hypothetical protein [Burkholderia pseudomallei]|uniref:hypothetical protein n=1 Tax=Burkholderia pseudomallei TaxID=28450 RepID=UPI0021F7E53C|nr:hypothetical protein [Burkholderia pseudomallei]MCW0082683.1 hypothetical protein [Burkholderia pseudomallei]
MKWAKLIASKLNFIFGKKMGIPRKESNKFEINFDEINHVMILQDDKGKPLWVIASGGDENRNFYFEEYSAELMNALGWQYGDCKHIFSGLNDAIKRGAEFEKILLSIKNLLK